MAHAVEEEEFGDHESFDKHERASSDDSHKSDYVHNADGVEDYEARACQGSVEERHYDCMIEVVRR